MVAVEAAAVAASTVATVLRRLRAQTILCGVIVPQAINQAVCSVMAVHNLAEDVTLGLQVGDSNCGRRHALK